MLSILIATVDMRKRILPGTAKLEITLNHLLLQMTYFCYLKVALVYKAVKIIWDFFVINGN